MTLAAIARETSSLRLGPMVVPLARRRPWKVALEAATLQALAHGRVIVGVGIGVARDYTSFGEPDAWRERIGKVEEGLALLRRLLSGKPVSHEGAYYRSHEVVFPHAKVPIWVGGFWPRTRRIVGARAADGFFPNVREPTGFRRPTPAEVREQLERFVADGGPPTGELAVMSLAGNESADIGAYVASGATWWLETPWDGASAIMAPDAFAAYVDGGPPR